MLSNVKDRLFDIKSCMSSRESLDTHDNKMLQEFDREVSLRCALRRMTVVHSSDDHGGMSR